MEYKYVGKCRFADYHTAPRQEEELICDNDVMAAFIDRFGTEVKTYPCDDDEEHFVVEAEVAVSKLYYNWILGFGGKVKIAGPEEVKTEYKKMVKKAAKEV